MQARLWLSGQCFECNVERIAPAADGWVVKTRARRYFRFDAASVALLSKLMGINALDRDDPAQASDIGFLQKRLIPLGIYALQGAQAAAPKPHASSGAMHWHRQLLAARHVRPLAAALAPLFSPWLLAPLMALCLWIHASYVLNTAGQIGYHDLLTYSPNELLLLASVAIVRGLLHEFGHAAACWRLTRSVGAIGYGVFIGTPVLYCDVSDIHLLPRRSKAIVGLAGTAMDIVLLALFIVIGGTDASVVKVYWLSMAAVLLNLVPFYRNDGYWVMNDLAGTSDLLKESLQACWSGTARTRDWLMLGFTALCVIGVLLLAIAFALQFGPEQLAEAAVLLPSFAGVVLALVTTLQYAALGFGAFAAAKTVSSGVQTRLNASRSVSV